MDLLLTGDLSNLVDEFCKQLAGGNRIVLASKNIAKRSFYNKPATFPIALSDPLFNRLFDSYSFNAVVFFAKRGEQTGYQTGMIEDLDHCLKLCVKHNVSHIIYVSSSEVYAGNDYIDEHCSPLPINSIGHTLAAGENLAKYYRTKFGLNTIVVHVPYLYGDSVSDSLLVNIYTHFRRNEKYVFQGSHNQQCDFIKDTDLVALVTKLIDEGYDLPHGVINVGSGNPISLYELVELIKKEIPNFEYEFSNVAGCVPPPMNIETAYSFYKWKANYKISDQLAAIINKFVENGPTRRTILHVLLEKASNSHGIITALELSLGFVLMQFLNSLSLTAIQYRYVDFRLLFVVVFGSIFGLRVGMIAVLLAFISCLLSYLGTGLDWKLLFFNVDNWLPFFVYFVAGAVTGYAKDKSVSALDLEKEQRNSVEERYIFLYELYDQTLKNKRQYQDQLLSYRDSFGRIYAITKRLDSILPDSVMHEAIVILEDLLDNQTIAIYTVNQNEDYARLSVSSKSDNNRMQSSIRLSKNNIMFSDIRHDKIWCNKELIEGYPAYCAPVFNHEKIIALIMINEVRYEQMTTYYYNLIIVLCGLIKDSLIRAVNYCVAIEDKIYIEGTRILKPSQFEDIMVVKQKMRDDNIANYELFRIDYIYSDISKLSNTIIQCIRSTDIIGRGRDGDIYLILSQVEQESIELVLHRLIQNGIHCRLVRSNVITDQMISERLKT